MKLVGVRVTVDYEALKVRGAICCRVCLSCRFPLVFLVKKGINRTARSEWYTSIVII